MKFIRVKKSERAGDSFVFHLSKRDRSLFLSILEMFPVMPADSHRLSKSNRADNKPNQELLIEAMAEQRRVHAKKIERFSKSDLFQETEHGLQLFLNGEQIEWLLQTLNDVRVGSWMRLGCPEMEHARRAIDSHEKASHYAAMELSGVFQSALLQAFQPETI